MAPTEGPAAPPLRRDAERNRRRVIDAAQEVFAEQGLHAGFDEIARRAGVGVGTVYRRFPDRDDLIDALFGDRVDLIVELAERAAGMPDEWQAVCWFLERSVEIQSADRGLKEVLGDGDRGHERLATARRRLEPAVGAVIRRAQGSGHLRFDLDAKDLAVLTGMLCTVATDERPDLWRRYLPIVLEGLRATPGAQEPLLVGPPEDHEMPSAMRRFAPRTARARDA